MLIEVLTLVGYYALHAPQMRVYRVPLPEGPSPRSPNRGGRHGAAEQLLAIEQIKQLKARYFRCMDTKDWDGYAKVFAPNAVLDVTGESAPRRRDRTRQRADRGVRARPGRPGDDRASRPHARDRDHVADHSHRDLVDGGHAAVAGRSPVAAMHGDGHYHETYEKIDGQWRIVSCKLTRLRVDAETS